MARYCCDHKCNSGRNCPRRIAARRLESAESAGRALLISEAKPAPESLPALLLRKGSLVHTKPDRGVSRAVVFARRAYRVVWIFVNTLTAKRAANREPKP